MLSDEMKTAIKILEDNGYNRDNYQGDEYKINGDLHDMTEASEAMFAEWMPVIINNWPGDPNDRMTKVIARNIGSRAITTVWKIGHILEVS